MDKDKEKEILRFQATRLVVALFKNYLISIEDLREEHDSMMGKIDSLLSEDDKNKLDLVDYLTDNKYAFIRKRILDLGNDAVREIENILDQYEVTFKKK